MSKTAVVTGAGGMDGSIISELLIDQGYKVYALFRRRSDSPNLGCSSELEGHPQFEPVEGDITDLSSLLSLCNLAKPDRFFHLASQSHVGTSFKEPIHTAHVTGIATLNCLEAIRLSGIHTRFYNSATSELWGGITDKPCNEDSLVYPRSPYACAKAFGFYITRNYRESYKMFASSGILFNHESLSYGNPLVFRDSTGMIDILPIGDIARFHTGILFDMSSPSGIQGGKPTCPLEVWDKNGWTKVKFVSGYPHQGDKNPQIINARNFVYSGTASHVCILEDGEKLTSEISVGDKVKAVEYPSPSCCSEVSLAEAEFLGMLVGDGYLNRKSPCFTNKSEKLRTRFGDLWNEISNGEGWKYYPSLSGFTGEKVGQVRCRNSNVIDFDIYCEEFSPFGHRLKKVPKKILNSKPEVMNAFLSGYNACDGLKKNPCAYLYKNFKTNSMTLAAGLLYLVSCVTGQEWNITVEKSDSHGKTQYYYSLNLLSPVDYEEKADTVLALIRDGVSGRSIHRRTGISRSFIRKIKAGYKPQTHHLRKVFNEVKKVISMDGYNGWFFDLETETGTFHAGVGNGVVHNSERRGSNFVTRKITLGVANIKAGRQKKLYLGNLDAKRDWGDAFDYCRGMIMILDHNEPDDFVLATGETHSVREFCQVAFDYAGLGDYQQYVEIDPRFFRPAEVDVLLGDYSKAKRVLGWEPKTSFRELVERMVDYDISLLE